MLANQALQVIILEFVFSNMLYRRILLPLKRVCTALKASYQCSNALLPNPGLMKL